MSELRYAVAKDGTIIYENDEQVVSYLGLNPTASILEAMDKAVEVYESTLPDNWVELLNKKEGIYSEAE